jgi:hypothetical protein
VAAEDDGVRAGVFGDGDGIAVGVGAGGGVKNDQYLYLECPEPDFRINRAFNNYAVKHPEIMKGVLKNACIFFAPRNQPHLTKVAKYFARMMEKEQGSPIYVAKLRAKEWTLERVRFGSGRKSRA